MKQKLILLSLSFFTAFCFIYYVRHKVTLGGVLGRIFLLSSDVSFQIRSSYVMNLLYTIKESWGVGLGIGQYGHFWKDIYLVHIDYRSFDLGGEVSNALAGYGHGLYMKPWSVILGIGVDLGILGLLVISLLLWNTFKAAITPHKKAIVLASTVMLMGAYPIVTPHLWIVLAFVLSTKKPSLDNPQRIVAGA